MKRLQRLWQLWLDLPLGMRPAIVGFAVCFGMWAVLWLWHAHGG